LVEKCFKEQNIDLNKAIYIENDMNDLEVMKIVGFLGVLADCRQRNKSHCQDCNQSKGGEGLI